MRWVILTVAFALFGCATAAPLPPKAIQLNDDGAAAFAQGDYETAEARISLALEYNPRFTEAWVNLGLVEMRRSNFAKAEKHFSHAQHLNPDIPAPFHAMGLLREKQGRQGDAEKEYRAALKVDPGFPAARVNLGRLLYARGAFEDAREQFLRLAEVAPDQLEAWTGLIESLLRLDRESEADDVLGRAREHFGDRPELSLLVGRQQLRASAFDAAEATFAPLTNDADRTRAASAWGWISIARFGRGDKDGGAQAAKEALAIDPAQPVALYALSR